MTLRYCTLSVLPLTFRFFRMLLLPLHLPLQIFELNPEVDEAEHADGGVKHDEHVDGNVENCYSNDTPAHDVLGLWLRDELGEGKQVVGRE